MHYENAGWENQSFDVGALQLINDQFNSLKMVFFILLSLQGMVSLHVNQYLHVQLRLGPQVSLDGATFYFP